MPGREQKNKDFEPSSEGQSQAPGMNDHSWSQSSLQSPDSQSIALQTMSQWVVAIADNIRNPVAGMRAALEVVRHQLDLKDDSQKTTKFDSDILHHALAMIGHRLASLNEYVTELVDFAKVPHINPQPTEIPEFIHSLIEETRRSFPFPVQISCELDAQATQLWVDPYRLRSSLRALIVNGVEASSPLMQEHGTPCIHLQVFLHPGEISPPMMSFVIEDNGPGFTQESRNRCLEAFFSTKEAGTGLGLFLVQKYMMAHGGRVIIEPPKVLTGARVGFMLPVLESTDGELSPSEE